MSRFRAIGGRRAAGRVGLRPRPFDIGRLVGLTIEDARALARRHDLDLDEDLVDGVHYPGGRHLPFDRLRVSVRDGRVSSVCRMTGGACG